MLKTENELEINLYVKQCEPKMHPFLQPLKLKNGMSLPHRIMPGPMEGVMSPLFCKVITDLGILDYWITPFIRLSNAVPHSKTLKKKIAFFFDTGVPVIVQLLGSEPELMARTSKELQQLGISGINLNFACPSRSVVSHRGGGSLLKEPKLMQDIINAIRDECPDLSISVKIRTGLDSPDEMKVNIPALCETDIDFLMIHYRTVREAYSNSVTDGLERLKKAVELAGDIPLIGSGNIFTLEDALSLESNAGCAGVTIARGLLKNPYLPKQVFNYCAGITEESDENYQIKFFKSMQKNVKETPDKYWKRPNFIEMCKFIWGVKHPIFQTIIHLADEELLTYEIPH